MSFRAISDETIQAIAALGFDVYRSPEKKWQSYLFFTDGTRIGYMEAGYFNGLRLSTVHVPNRQCGAGFSLTDDGDSVPVTRESLESAFVEAPRWASAADRAAVRKWADWETFNERGRYVLAAKGVR